MFNFQKLLILSKTSSFCILTAENPLGKATPKDNEYLNQELIKELIGKRVTPVTGVWNGQVENSFIIEDITLDEVQFLRMKYHQQAVIYAVNGQFCLVIEQGIVQITDDVELIHYDTDCYTILPNGEKFVINF